MSMLDSFFNKGFRAAKCKTLLKLTIPRIKLLRNRRENQLKQMRRDIAKLLETGQEATARIRVEHIIREENMMAAQEILELFCELVAVRLPIIETQRECPLDLKEAISSLCFAAPRCADLPELLQVQMSFAGKYGREFVAAATELMPDCGVNRQLIELLSIRAPSAEKKLKLLKQIAEEHDLDWDPVDSETELFKSHDDLLNGPNQFASGTKFPLPEEKKHDEASQADPTQAHEEQDDSDGDLDLDFPEVPKVSVRPAEKTVASAPHLEIDPDLLNHLRAVGNPPEEEPKVTGEKQFVPFISAPSLSSSSFSAREETPVSPPLTPADSRTKSEAVDIVDLRDVMAAAQAAAQSAERAAAVARSAASLAHLRINELTNRNPDQVSKTETDRGAAENPFNGSAGAENPFTSSADGSPERLAVSPAKPRFDSRDSFDEPRMGLFGSEAVSNLPPNHSHKPDFDTGLDARQPQRLPSMDDEQDFSYPNLFRSQSSKLESPSHSFKDHSRSPQDR